MSAVPSLETVRNTFSPSPIETRLQRNRKRSVHQQSFTQDRFGIRICLVEDVTTKHHDRAKDSRLFFFLSTALAQLLREGTWVTITIYRDGSQFRDQDLFAAISSDGLFCHRLQFPVPASNIVRLVYKKKPKLRALQRSRGLSHRFDRLRRSRLQQLRERGHQ